MIDFNNLTGSYDLGLSENENDLNTQRLQGQRNELEACSLPPYPLLVAIEVIVKPRVAAFAMCVYLLLKLVRPVSFWPIAIWLFAPEIVITFLELLNDVGAPLVAVVATPDLNETYVDGAIIGSLPAIVVAIETLLPILKFLTTSSVWPAVGDGSWPDAVAKFVIDADVDA